MNADLATPLSHALERTVIVRAQRDTVFRFFTDSAWFARWWGEGSTIDPRPGGALYIRHPGAVVSRGVVLAIEQGRSIVFSYGYESGQPIGPGASRITIRLDDDPQGTLLHLHHELSDEAVRDGHVQGWRYQLSVFAQVAAAAQFADVDALCDRFLAAWNEEDAERRRSALDAIASPAIEFRDQYSALRGIDDLAQHLVAVRVHMPGVRLVRTGPARHCQGTVVFPWEARAAAGEPRGQGSNVLLLAPDGRIDSVTGIWG